MKEEETPAGEVKPEQQEKSQGVKEDLYDKIPLSKKQLDIIIVILIIAFLAVLTFGVLVGNDIL